MIPRKTFSIKRKNKKPRIKGKKPHSISKLVKLCDKQFSLLVRQRGANGEGIAACYTCGHQAQWRKQHAGHYLSRFYKAARWDFDNARNQCFLCNIYKKGDPISFRQNLIKEIGIERVEAVEAKRHQSTKLTREFLQNKLIELTSLD